MGLIHRSPPLPCKSESPQQFFLKKVTFNVSLFKKTKSHFPSSSKWRKCLYDLPVCKPSNFPKYSVKITSGYHADPEVGKSTSAVAVVNPLSRKEE